MFKGKENGAEDKGQSTKAGKRQRKIAKRNWKSGNGNREPKTKN